MRNKHNQSGLSLMEIAFAILIFAIVTMAAIYGVQAVQSAKIKALIIQFNHVKTSAEIFRRQYGTWPGDYAQAQTRLNNCTVANQCENGNGDQIVASSNSTGCVMPSYTVGAQDFPCTTLTGGNETAQFWRHMALAGMVENLTLRNNRYRWGESMPRVRLGGGLQVLYNGDVSNVYVRNLVGHFLIYQRLPTLLHTDFDVSGDGALSSRDARKLDTEMDDGLPDTGNFRATGGFACHDPSSPGVNVYSSMGQMDCSIFYKYSQ